MAIRVFEAEIVHAHSVAILLAATAQNVAVARFFHVLILAGPAHGGGARRSGFSIRGRR